MTHELNEEDFAARAGVTVVNLARWEKQDPEFPSRSGGYWDATEVAGYLENLLSIQEVAGILGVGVSSARKLRRQAEPAFPEPVVLRRKAELWRRAAIEEYMSQLVSRAPRQAAQRSPESPYVSLADFVKVLGVGVGSIYRLSDTPKFPAPVFESGRLRLWLRKDAEAFRDFRAGGPAPRPRRKKAVLLDRQAIAERTGLSSSTILSESQLDPDFPAPAVPGRYPVWEPADVDAWFADRVRGR